MNHDRKLMTYSRRRSDDGRPKIKSTLHQWVQWQQPTGEASWYLLILLEEKGVPGSQTGFWPIKIAEWKRPSAVSLHNPKEDNQHRHEVRYCHLAHRSPGCCHGGSHQCHANRRWYELRAYQRSPKCLTNRRRSNA